MAKIAYTDPKNIRTATRNLLAQITEVVERYQAEGYVLSLRQLYYQLVSEDILANNLGNYSKLSDILKDARMCGQVDWDVIEDRTRVPKRPTQWNSIQEIANAAASQFRLDRHEDQENYIEVWIEKDALTGIFEPVTSKYHVHLMANKGYSSVSAMQKASVRFEEAAQEGKNLHILYFGDHDPSGLDMDRDIRDRMYEFGIDDLLVTRMALTKEQIKQYAPPPNPAKFSDPRATEYISEHGKVSWELDALKPKVLTSMLTKQLESMIDMDKYNEIVELEDEQKEKLLNLAQEI